MFLIINRYVKGSLPATTNPTIGVEFATKTVTLTDGTCKIKNKKFILFLKIKYI